MEANERLLIEKARGGDGDAFAGLIEPCADRLFAVCLRMTGNETDAADALQEALIKLFLHVGEFGSRSSFYTYAYRVAVNVCLDMQKKRRPVVSIEEIAEERAATPDPADALLAGELREDVSALLLRLREEYRAVLVLRDMQGFSYDEVARILGISEGTLKSRLFRAREQMRKLVKEAGLL